MNNQIKHQKRLEILFSDSIVKKELEEYKGNLLSFESLTLNQFKSLIENNLIDKTENQNGGPSVLNFYNFGNKYKEFDIKFNGYIVDNTREDCRITITGCKFYIQPENIINSIPFLKEFYMKFGSADEFNSDLVEIANEEFSLCFRCWYD